MRALDTKANLIISVGMAPSALNLTAFEQLITDY